MAWQDWDQNDNRAVENETVSPFSNTAPQPTNFSSQWLFSPNAAAPAWPQTYNETPLATTSGAFFSSAIDKSMSPFGGSFGDAAAWEDWDAWGDIGNKGNGELNGGLDNGLGSGLDAQHIWPGSMVGIYPQETIISNPISYPPKRCSSERASARIGETYSTHTKAKSFSMQSGEAGNRP